MLNVSVSEARRKFAEILDRVGRGKERIAVGAGAGCQPALQAS